MASKAECYTKLQENFVCEWVQDNTVSVKHVADKLNPADIFIKEMQDGCIHFRWLWDLFMTQLSNFLNTSFLEVHHAR